MSKKLLLLPIYIGFISFLCIILGDILEIPGFNRNSGYIFPPFGIPILYTFPGWIGVVIVAVVWFVTSFLLASMLLLIGLFLYAAIASKMGQAVPDDGE